MGVFSIPLWSQGWLLTRQLKFPNPKQTPPGPKAIPVRSLSWRATFAVTYHYSDIAPAALLPPRLRCCCINLLV